MHPIVFTPLKTAQQWKDDAEKVVKSPSEDIFSSLGNLVTKKILESFSNREREKRVVNALVTMKPKFEQYFRDGASVSTPYGPGLVKRFRAMDGFYEIHLLRWKLGNGSYATATLKKCDISHRIADGCIEGYPVLTRFGLTGILESVDPQTGVHLVCIPSAGMICYFQPEFVVRPLKAAVGTDVLTPYGDGKIIEYLRDTDTYVISLQGWKAKLYGKAETFDLVVEKIQDRGTLFGIILNMLFPSDASQQSIHTRSRSNSITSLAKSASGRSIK
jgi:hypothetical protein